MTVGINITGSTCELLTRDIDVVTPCDNSMNSSYLSLGPLVTRITPSYKFSKVPHLLYSMSSVADFDVICARQCKCELIVVAHIYLFELVILWSICVMRNSLGS